MERLMNIKMVKQSGGPLTFKLFNCFLLVSILMLVLYTIKQTSDIKDNKENSGRVKRCSDDQDTDQPGTDQPGGATYTRWGRTTCDALETELVYSGVAGGSWYDHTGGGSNYICLPTDPEWNKYRDTAASGAFVYGAEYHLQSTDFPFSSTNAENFHNHNVPCAVCRTNGRGSILMIPARMHCYDGWTEQYHGYLMAGRYAHKGRTEFVCMDENPEVTESGHENEDGALFYTVEGVCGSLPCPPYVQYRELTCAVCSK